MPRDENLIRSDVGKKRGTYKTRPIEKRGIQKKEPRVTKSFWRNHNMDDIMQMTDEELSLTVDKFMDNYIEINIKRNPRWFFPESLRA